MRRNKFYPTRVVSSFVLLLLLVNAFSALAQDPGPNINKPTTCIDHNPDTVGSVYQYTYTGTGVNPTWTVKGDIQLLNAAGNVVDTLVGTAARIRSTAGYGKGRLTVTFNQSSCAYQQEYVDVYKAFSLFDEWPAGNPANDVKNSITGARCVTPGTNVTYSINPVVSRNLDQNIGIDTYQWVVPPTWTVNYTSADRSFIVLTAPPVIGNNDSLKVYVGKCNPAPYSLKLTGPVPAPVITPIACVPASATGTTVITLSVQNPSPEYAYDWILPANSNWSYASGYDGKDETQVSIVVDNSVNSVGVAAKRRMPSGDADCDVSVSAYQKINRSLAVGSRLMGLACVDGTKFNTYTVTDANGTALSGDFEWTFTPAAGNMGEMFSVSSPSGPSVSFKAGTTGGVLSATRPGCTGTAASLSITSSPARSLALSGPTCVAPNSTGHVYSIQPVAGATSYTWTLGPGLTSSSTLGNGGTSITVNAGNTSGSIISVVANNGTCASMPQQLMVTLNAVAPTSLAATQSCINRGAADEVVFNVNYSTPAPAGQTYEWRVIYPTGVTTGWTVKGTSTNGSTVTATTGTSITYVTNGTIGSYRVEARAVRAGCTASAWISSATLSTARAIAIGRQDLIDETGQKIGELLVASSISGATYRWTRTSSTGTTTVLPETGATIDLAAYGDGNFSNYCVTATVNGCTTSTACLQSQYNTYSARVSSGQTSPEQLSSQVVVYPNPTTDGEFTLQLPASKGQAGVVLKNLQGQVVYKTEMSKTKSKLSAGKLSSGVYLLQVSLDGKVVTKKVTVKQ